MAKKKGKLVDVCFRAGMDHSDVILIKCACAKELTGAWANKRTDAWAKKLTGAWANKLTGACAKKLTGAWAKKHVPGVG